MNKKLLELLKRPSAMLVFGLLSGGAYFAIVLELLSGYFSEQNKLIIYFFAPVIICGAALVLLKLIKQHYETENYSKIKIIFWVHILLAVIAACMVAAGIR
ncbi:MAG: hypothetical protein Q4G33_07140 [bacterium]|nr:hypothetical protein [bacterium]